MFDLPRCSLYLFTVKRIYFPLKDLPTHRSLQHREFTVREDLYQAGGFCQHSMTLNSWSHLPGDLPFPLRYSVASSPSQRVRLQVLIILQELLLSSLGQMVRTVFLSCLFTVSPLRIPCLLISRTPCPTGLQGHCDVDLKTWNKWQTCWTGQKI